MPATPAITPPSGAIAAKTTRASPTATTGDAFGQVLQSVSGATPGLASTPTTDGPGQPASALAIEPAAEADADQAAVVPTPAVGISTGRTLAGVPPVEATPADKPKTSITAPSGTSLQSGKQGSQTVISQVVDPTAATPAPSSIPAPAAAASIQDPFAAAVSACLAAAPASAGAAPAVAAARGTATAAGSVTATVAPKIPVAASANHAAGPAAAPASAEPDSALPVADTSAPAVLPATADRAGVTRNIHLLPAQQTVPSGDTSPATPAADNKTTLRPVEDTVGPTQPATAFATLLDQPVPIFTPTAVPPPLTGVATPHPHTASPAAEQVSPALLTLAKTIDGSQQMTVRLQPVELGMVQVRIARAVSGETQIEITAEKTDTLLALERDQPQLHRTLDEAGIPAAGRTMTFHAAQPAPASASSNGSGSGSSQQGSATRGTAGNTDLGGSSGGRASYPARKPNTYSSGRQSIGSIESANANLATATKSYRVGLDITA